MIVLLNNEELVDFDYNSKPKKKFLPLKRVAEFYRDKICGYKYSYKTDLANFEIEFEESQFCHLVGIHHVGNKVAQMNNNDSIKFNYRGVEGWNRIMNETITYSSLKSNHAATYNTHEDRMLFLPVLHQVLRTPEIVKYHQLRVKGMSLINADFILYSKKTNKRRKVQMNLAIREENGQLVPVSFQVTYEPKDQKYTKGQEDAEIHEIVIESLNDPLEAPYISPTPEEIEEVN